jgi:lipoprotein-anchoring transpeptidase ErfK/SrfK
VAGLNVGGKTIEEAAPLLQQYAASQMLAVTDGSRSFAMSLPELGVTLDVAGTLDMAKESFAGASLVPLYTIDLVQAQNGLISLSEIANIDAVPGSPPQIGRALEIPVMLDRLRADVTGELADGVFELNMMDVLPPEPEAVSVSNYNGPTTTHVVEAGQELALIARIYGVDMADIVALNDISDPDLIWIGQELIVPAGGVYQPSAAEAPPAPTNVGKSIVVWVEKQRIYAYENGQLVHSHLTSTGRSATPTVYGDYKIYVKYEADDMSGPDYFLPQVPYVMYFYQGYGIHGTYWHNSFGRPMSHGCVNLPVGEAKWFFDWAQVGTPVRVI